MFALIRNTTYALVLLGLSQTAYSLDKNELQAEINLVVDGAKQRMLSPQVTRAESARNGAGVTVYILAEDQSKVWNQKTVCASPTFRRILSLGGSITIIAEGKDNRQLANATYIASHCASEIRQDAANASTARPTPAPAPPAPSPK